MAKIIKMEKISLKNNPAIKEDLIQSFIFENPSVLGLGELSPIQTDMFTENNFLKTNFGIIYESDYGINAGTT
ncbi:MAG: hypothetical protein IIX97_04650, partial [Clostridia bacterium]|nr:hypothetical protein [Clostridia bacterium]